MTLISARAKWKVQLSQNPSAHTFCPVKKRKDCQEITCKRFSCCLNELRYYCDKQGNKIVQQVEH